MNTLPWDQIIGYGIAWVGVCALVTASVCIWLTHRKEQAVLAEDEALRARIVGLMDAALEEGAQAAGDPFTYDARMVERLRAELDDLSAVARWMGGAQ